MLCKTQADDTGAFSCAASVPTTNGGRSRPPQDHGQGDDLAGQGDGRVHADLIPSLARRHNHAPREAAVLLPLTGEEDIRSSGRTKHERTVAAGRRPGDADHRRRRGRHRPQRATPPPPVRPSISRTVLPPSATPTGPSGCGPSAAATRPTSSAPTLTGSVAPAGPTHWSVRHVLGGDSGANTGPAPLFPGIVRSARAASACSVSVRARRADEVAAAYRQPGQGPPPDRWAEADPEVQRHHGEADAAGQRRLPRPAAAPPCLIRPGRPGNWAREPVRTTGTDAQNRDGRRIGA